MPSQHTIEAEMMIARVGDRVRRARAMKTMPRRVLSERSGVSPRYLAQLEAGEGNISIALLARVAAALDQRVEWLLAENDPLAADALRVAEMFAAAPAETRGKVLDALTPHARERDRAQRICLIGLRGAGKSTLGALAGEALNVPFLELNLVIEDKAGIPVNEILALYGQDGYRRLEAQALDQVIGRYQTLILAAAGGIVAEPEAYKTLLARFHTIWIQARPEDHMARVRRQGDTRPMAGNPEAMDQLRAILASREPLYGKAMTRLDTSGKPLGTSADELAALIRRQGYLGQAG